MYRRTDVFYKCIYIDKDKTDKGGADNFTTIVRSDNSCIIV